MYVFAQTSLVKLTTDGMLVDQIVSFDIVCRTARALLKLIMQVLSNGQYLQGVTADHQEYSDLFWVRVHRLRGYDNSR